MPAIAIDLDRIASAFTRCATVFSTRLRRAATRGIFTLVLVGHEIPPEELPDYLDAPRVAH